MRSSPLLLAVVTLVLLASACMQTVCEGEGCPAGSGGGAASGGGTGTGGGEGTGGGVGTGGGWEGPFDGGPGGGAGGGSGPGGGAGGGSAECSEECIGGTFCDEATRDCVRCTATRGCGGPTPVCDLTANDSVGTCVECVFDTECSTARPRCSVARTCVQCTANLDCPASAPLCRGDGTCVACLTSNQCGPGLACTPGGRCEALPDTCATAQVLPVPAMGQRLEFDVTTAGTTDDAVGSCSPAGGGELVYRLSIPAAVAVTVTAQRAASSLANPVLYLRSGACANGLEVACSNGTSVNDVERVALVNRPAGDYFLFVEGVGANQGPVHLVVTTTPVNDDCAGAQAIAFVGGVGAVSGTTVGSTNSNGANDDSPTCSWDATATGQDLVYSYTLTAAQDVSVQLAPSSAGQRLSPVLVVKQPGACANPAGSTELACEAPLSGPARRTFLNQPPGTYFVFVDTNDSRPGGFTLEVTLAPPSLPPANDVCGGALPLTFVGPTATVTGDTRLATNDNAPADSSPICSPSAQATGRDVVYSYTLTSPRDVNVTVTPTGSNPRDYDPVVYVRGANACNSGLPTDELACHSIENEPPASPAQVRLLNQPPGTYFVWVDGANDTSGPFSLEVSLAAPSQPPVNDTCAAPTVLTAGLPATTATFHASTNTYSDYTVPRYSATCAALTAWDERDVFFQVTATATGRLSITATPGAGLDLGLLLLGTSCGPTYCSAVADVGIEGDAETLAFSAVAGQTYFIAAEVYSEAAGATESFTIRAQ